MELSELEGSNADEEEFEDEDAREDPPIAPGAKLAKGKSRAAPKTSPFHGDDLPSTSPSASAARPGISHAAFDMWTVLHRSTKPKMPWETAVFSKPFEPKFKKPKLEVPQIGFREALSAPSRTPAAGSLEQSSSLSFARQRLRFAAMIKTEDQLRWEALRKIKVVVLLNPLASSIGETLATQAMTLCDASEFSTSFTNCFAAKSTGTLVKRSYALWRFSQWCADRGVLDPLSASESVVYAYVCFLQEHAAPTSGVDFLQMWRFMHHVLGLKKYPLDVVLSSRTKGLADSMHATKRKLRQSEPLQARMILALEKIVLGAPYVHWQVIAGQFLLCIGSCSRFSDSIYLDSLVHSCEGELHLLEADESKYKTSTNRERKARLLPICSLGQFLANSPWAPKWIEIRLQQGLATSPSLPAWSEISASWMSRRMTTSEAHTYLHEFLRGSGFSHADLVGIGTHSMKTTLLSWSSKGQYLDLPDRRLMGHHLDPGSNSAVTYSRDELTRLQVSVHKMFQDVKSGAFRPDDTRVQRLSASIGLTKPDDEPGPFESDSGESGSGPESDCGEGEANRTAMSLEPSRVPFDDLALESVVDSKVHISSGVLHLTGKNGFFLCGRKITVNYEDIGNTSLATDVPVCMQCAKASGHS